MSEPDLGLVPTTETEPLYPRKPPTIKPLSDDELSTLESHLRVPLPSAYREFVQQVGPLCRHRSAVEGSFPWTSSFDFSDGVGDFSKYATSKCGPSVDLDAVDKDPTFGTLLLYRDTDTEVRLVCRGESVGTIWLFDDECGRGELAAGAGVSDVAEFKWGPARPATTFLGTLMKTFNEE